MYTCVTRVAMTKGLHSGLALLTTWCSVRMFSASDEGVGAPAVGDLVPA